jgi:hypothetical protein
VEFTGRRSEVALQGGGRRGGRGGLCETGREYRTRDGQGRTGDQQWFLLFCSPVWHVILLCGPGKAMSVKGILNRSEPAT